MRRKSRSEIAWQQWLDHVRKCAQCAGVQNGKHATPCPDGEEMLIVHRMWERAEPRQPDRG